MAIDVTTLLASDEGIVSEYKHRKNRYYATDRRLIFTRKGNLRDASYNHINSINLNRVSHKVLIVLGILFFLGGIGLAAMGSVGFGIFTLVVGLILIILFFLLRGTVYSFSLSSGQFIDVPKTKSSNVDEFVKSIRDKMR